MSGSSIFASFTAALHTPLLSFKSFNPDAKANSALNAFDADLSAQLHHLKSITFDSALDGSTFLSMPWLCDAMKLVLSTHSYAETFVPELKQALLQGDTKWLNAYLDDSIKLLDTCNALKDAIKEIQSYHAQVKVALLALDKAYIGEAQIWRARNALSACTDAIKRKEKEHISVHVRTSKLENCSSMLRRMGEKLNMEDTCKGDFFKVSHAAQVITIFMCGVLTATLSLKPCRPLSTIALGRQFSWSNALTSLQQRLKEQMERQKVKRAHALLPELCMTDNAVHALKVSVEKILESKKFPLKEAHISNLTKHAVSLRACSVEMKSGLDLLQQHVEDVVQTLITSRMLLLDIYSCH